MCKMILFKLPLQHIIWFLIYTANKRIINGGGAAAAYIRTREHIIVSLAVRTLYTKPQIKLHYSRNRGNCAFLYYTKHERTHKNIISAHLIKISLAECKLQRFFFSISFSLRACILQLSTILLVYTLHLLFAHKKEAKESTTNECCEYMYTNACNRKKRKKSFEKKSNAAYIRTCCIRMF